MDIADPDWDPKQALAEFTTYMIKNRSDNNQTDCKKISSCIFDVWDIAAWLHKDIVDAKPIDWYNNDIFYQRASDMVTVWQQFNGVKPGVSGRFTLIL